ncbi:DUF4012 domain-containing protein [Nocardioides sp. TRM66260-LWL]|uniref:DUF4012 domain-containing protein n=1 Tax=Nocardioides sp. TRM66260-LWL TaxID=2874478 RepID=UPI001CC54038|nr:DUF4012 domain-containing protein [Nocardioides sp. TRM66260-LWL]MBZ5734889.1 DUF4012 domain-containing protein [Nocardioides sp. TRM66260-LWL]
MSQSEPAPSSDSPADVAARRGRRRRLLRVLLVAVVLVGAWAAWTGWLAWTARGDLTSASADAQRLRAAVTSGDRGAADAAAADLRGHTRGAADATGGWAWGLATLLPRYGDDAAAVRAASRALAGLAEDGVPGLLKASDGVDALTPRDGRIDVEALTALRPPVADGAAAARAAAADLDGVASGGLVPALRGRFDELRTQVDDLRSGLDAADRALGVLPGLLGGDGQRRYLLVFQNNAEIRATGGLPGAVAVLDADRGRISLGPQVAGREVGGADQRISRAEAAVFGPQMGQYFLDAGFTPDFPRAAQLMRDRWLAARGGRIDGVVALDAVTTAGLLRATGPVDVEGVRLDADNAVDELLAGVYRRFPDPDRQDAFFQGVTSAVFAKITSGQVDARRLVESLADAAGDGRLLVASQDEQEQQVLAAAAVGGDLARGPHRDDVVVALNDATGAKMSTYLRTSMRLRPQTCADGVRTLRGSVRLTSIAPADAGRSLPSYVTGGGAFDVTPGNQVVRVHLLAPPGRTLERVTIDRTVREVPPVELDGRSTTTLFIELRPGQTTTVSYDLPGAADAPATRAVVTPGVAGATSTAAYAGTCG